MDHMCPGFRLPDLPLDHPIDTGRFSSGGMGDNEDSVLDLAAGHTHRYARGVCMPTFQGCGREVDWSRGSSTRVPAFLARNGAIPERGYSVTTPTGASIKPVRKESLYRAHHHQFPLPALNTAEWGMSPSSREAHRVEIFKQ
jgi:hypothetical protein